MTRGIIAAMPFRTGGLIIPVITEDSSNITLEMNLPKQSKILCTSCAIENESTLISNGDIEKTSVGYNIKNNIESLKIIRSKTETAPITIINGREILYCDKVESTANLSSPLYFRRAVVYKNQMHVLMGETTTTHYKSDGVNWYYASTLPYGAKDSKVVVYNDELHLFTGTLSGTTPYHYKWNGSTWTKVSTIPNADSRIAAFVYDNQLHIIGPYKATGSTPKTCMHLRLNGTTWEQVSTLPFYINLGTALVVDGKIHAFGGDSLENHYEWDGTSWTKLSPLPILYGDTYGCAVVYNNELHILGGVYNSTKHYKWDGTNWVDVSTLPFPINSSAACVFDGKIQLISSATVANKNKHYEWDGTSWKNTKDISKFNFPIGCRINESICMNNGENIVPKADNYIIEY